MKNYNKSTHERESENILLVESRLQLKESGIRHQRLESGQLASKTWNLESKTALDSFTYMGQYKENKPEKRRVTFPNRPPA